MAQCSLTICRDHTLRRLLPSQFTGDQWKYYWGITETDKFGRLYEAMSMTFFGLWTSWFLTFMIGLPLATVLGTVSVVWTGCMRFAPCNMRFGSILSTVLFHYETDLPLLLDPGSGPCGIS